MDVKLKIPENSSTKKLGEHIRSGFSLFQIWSKISMMYAKVKKAWESFANPQESTQWR